MKIAAALWLLPLLISCNKTPDLRPGSDEAYFPLRSGSYSLFKVEKTRYISGEPPQFTSLQMRRSVLDSVPNSEGSIFPLRYSTVDGFNEWKTDSVTAAWLTSNRAFEQENGLPVVKMQFPLSDGLRWNANLYNAAKENSSVVTQLGKPFQLHNRFYPNTVTIVRQDDSTLLTRKKYIEIYGVNAGLIYRERVNLQYCHSGECIGKGIVDSGWKEVLILESTGK